MGNVFTKTCFECGKKDNDLYQGRCIECFKQINPPIKEVKPINFKIDNVTKEICYNNYYYTFDKLLVILPSIVKKHVVLNDYYELNDLEVVEPHIDGHKFIFDIEVDCDLKNE